MNIYVGFLFKIGYDVTIKTQIDASNYKLYTRGRIMYNIL